MKIEDQVLSIEQVRELLKLGFDIEKHSSMCWVAYTSDEEPYEKEYSLSTHDIYCYESSSLEPIPTLSIGDIMDILPKVINSHGIEYGRNADYGLSLIYLNKYYIRYIGIHISLALIIFESYNLIDVLFEALKWCIKEKHIKL